MWVAASICGGEPVATWASPHETSPATIAYGVSGYISDFRPLSYGLSVSRGTIRRPGNGEGFRPQLLMPPAAYAESGAFSKELVSGEWSKLAAEEPVATVGLLILTARVTPERWLRAYSLGLVAIARRSELSDVSELGYKQVRMHDINSSLVTTIVCHLHAGATVKIVYVIDYSKLYYNLSSSPPY